MLAANYFKNMPALASLVLVTLVGHTGETQSESFDHMAKQVSRIFRFVFDCYDGPMLQNHKTKVIGACRRQKLTCF